MTTSITIDGKPVISGAMLFKMMDTSGLPLVFMLDMLPREKYAIDWIEIIDLALLAGQKPSGILAKLKEGIYESYGSRDPYAIQVINKITSYVTLGSLPDNFPAEGELESFSQFIKEQP